MRNLFIILALPVSRSLPVPRFGPYLSPRILPQLTVFILPLQLANPPPSPTSPRVALILPPAVMAPSTGSSLSDSHVSPIAGHFVTLGL